jgi:hypothetical protein
MKCGVAKRWVSRPPANRLLHAIVKLIESK